jgi:acyl carrier protein
MAADTQERVHKLIGEHLGCNQDKVIGSATLADDLGADSLNITELEMALEEEFSIELPVGNTNAFALDTTVDQVVSTVDQLRR